MIVCSYCKVENDENAKFCHKCGNALTIDMAASKKEDLSNLSDSLNAQTIQDGKQAFNPKKAISRFFQKGLEGIKKSVFFRKKKNTIITFLAIVLILLLTVGVFNSGYIVFTAVYSVGKYDLAKEIQEWEINS